MSKQTTTLALEPVDHKRLAKLCGQLDEHLKQIEKRLSVKIQNRGNVFYIEGGTEDIQNASSMLTKLYDHTQLPEEMTPQTVHLLLQEPLMQPSTKPANNALEKPSSDIVIHTKKGAIRGRTDNQKHYLEQIDLFDVTFGIGPAGTGKTYLAVAMAIHALEKELISRIILVRPVVEAGERLGFLPGDLAQKIDPYLRPLYDALNEMMGAEKVLKLLEKGIIEIAPLAYMRGRTLNDAFIILDESQNCTKEQMKMFLTRLGFGSKAVITGDLTQVDLPRERYSGLRHAIDVLSDIDELSFCYFTGTDVVRHPLITRIVNAYEKHYHQSDKDPSL